MIAGTRRRRRRRRAVNVTRSLCRFRGRVVTIIVVGRDHGYGDDRCDHRHTCESDADDRPHVTRQSPQSGIFDSRRARLSQSSVMKNRAVRYRTHVHRFESSRSANRSISRTDIRIDPDFCASGVEGLTLSPRHPVARQVPELDNQNASVRTVIAKRARARVAN